MTNASAGGPRAPLGDREALERITTFLRGVAAGDDFEDRLELHGADETAAAAMEVINTLMDKLWARDFEVDAERELLERLVEIRTREVREILDHVHAGFLIVLRDGTVLGNHSKSCNDIFATATVAGRTLPDLMGLDGAARLEFQLGMEQVFEDVLPIELTLSQLRGEFSIGPRMYRIEAAPLHGADGSIGRLFITVSETTDLRIAERENRLRIALIEILSHREGFAAILRDFERGVQEARAAPTQARIRAVLHTIKGNLGCFQLQELAALVHAYEDRQPASLEALDAVEAAIAAFLDAHRSLLGISLGAREGGGVSARTEVPRAALDRIVEDPSVEARRALAAQLLRRLSWSRVADLVPTLRAMVERTAQRRGLTVRFTLRGDEVLVDAEQIGGVLATLPHLVRNAVVHGIEPASERGVKPGSGRVEVVVADTGSAWTIRVRDDGRGINTARVAEAAIAAGAVTEDAVAAMGHDERLALIFLSGVSSATEVGLDAGRGEGAGAFRAGVVAAGGEVRVRSKPGEGTCFFATIPHPP